jgi:hypothetical protein
MNYYEVFSPEIGGKSYFWPIMLYLRTKHHFHSFCLVLSSRRTPTSYEWRWCLVLKYNRNGQKFDLMYISGEKTS